MTDLDRTIRLVNSSTPMTVADLQDAAAALSRGARTGDVTACVARVRVAFRLEKLGV